jgi:pimeloyl-ACP methyl ester carboxylesterase
MSDTMVPSIIDATVTRRGDGQVAVVYVHGFLDDRHVWDAVAARVDAQAFESVQVDLAGSGARADADGPFDYERFATDVGAVIDHIGKPFVVVGQSMGSAIAELVAAARPDRARGLVLVAPVPLAGVGMPDEAIEPFASLGGDAEAQRAVRKQLSVSMPERDLERLVSAGAALRPEVVRAFADCWNGGHPDGAGVSRYAGPVLVVRGSGDPFVTDELLSAGVTSRLPQAGTVLVGEAGHWPHLEQPLDVAARISEFLDNVVADSSRHTASEVRPQGWTQAFADKSEDSFAEKFAEDVVLEASALQRPAEGRELVKIIMATATKIYESLVFTYEAEQGSRTYLEWEATALGGLTMSGVTVLAKNADGKIARAAIHHRPLGALHKFSGELRRRLDGTVDSSYFYGG